MNRIVVKFIIIAMTGSAVFTVFSSCGLNVRALPGEVLMGSYKVKKDNLQYGVGLYSFTNDEYRIIIPGSQTYDEAVFNEGKTKILLLKRKDGRDKPDDYIIYEYDIRNRELTGLVRNRLKVSKSFGLDFKNIRYVPNRNAISYIWGVKKNAIYIYDKDTGKEESIVTDEPRSYNWSRDGKYILMDWLGEEIEDHIYKYDLTAKEKTIVCKGAFPIYSHNNEYIVYWHDSKKGAETIAVRELSTGQEWYYTNPRGLIERDYKFSPDDRYILFREQYNDYLSYMGNFVYEDTKVWDFKTGTVGWWLKDKEGYFFDWR